MSAAMRAFGEDLERIPWLRAGAISPDATRIAAAVRQWDPDAGQDVYELRVLQRSTGAWMTLATPPEPDAPRFAPDGRALAFTALDPDGTRQLFVAVDGTVTPLTALGGGVRGVVAWSPCGQRLAFAAALETGPPTGEPLRVTRRFWRWDGIGPIERALTEIWVVDANGDAPHAITSCDGIASDPSWSPDGTRILYRSRCTPDCVDPVTASLRVAGTGDADPKDAFVVPASFAPARGAWVGDDEIAFVGVEEATVPAVQAHLYVTRLGGTPIQRGRQGHVDFAAMLETDMPSLVPFAAAPLFVDGARGHVYVRAQVGGRIEILRTVLADHAPHTPVCTGDRACYPLDLASDAGVLLVATSSMAEPLELVAVDLALGTEERLTDFGAATATQRAAHPEPRRIVAAREGFEVEGWFSGPAGASLPAPTVLYVHGGPHYGLGHVFLGDAHLLRAAGFGVLLVNHRGSTGYGEPFSTSLYGRWGDADVGDLLAVVDRAVAEGLVDPERLGVCGASGGGNLTCSLVAQTKRFRAAVAENPVTNFVSHYGTSDIGVPFAEREVQGAAPEAFAAWLAQSPVAQTGGWSTPTLLIHGDDDLRCPREQSEQFYRALHEAGCVAEMLFIPGADHVGTVHGPTPMRRLQDEALVEWMLRWLA